MPVWRWKYEGIAMAAVATLSNHFKFQLASGNIDFDSDIFKVILMNTTFVFDKDACATLSDVTADQLSTGNGYNQDDEILANVSVTENDTDDRCDVIWDDVTWTASGGDIGGTGAAIIYDDTTPDDTVVGCIDFGADFTAPDGSTLQLQNLAFRLA